MTLPDRRPTLDAQFCFAVYSAMHSVTRTYRPLLDELGLTYPQYLIMLVLWEEGAQNLGSLAMRVQIESSTLTPLVKRLESRGLVSRRRNPDDERQLIVALTARGESLRDRAAALPTALLRAAGCASTELDEMRARLVEIRDSIDSSLRQAQS